MKIALHEGLIPGDHLRAKLDLAEAWGIQGL